jgi:hypothetical protein
VIGNMRPLPLQSSDGLAGSWLDLGEASVRERRVHDAHERFEV